MKNIVTFLVFMILGWKVSVSLASNPDVETTVKALKFIRMVHKVYDAKVEGYSNYHDHFAGGVNPWSNRTRPGYIIIEGYYGTLVSTVHTPLGYISTFGEPGGTPDSTDKINQAVKDLPGIKLKLICPEYLTATGHMGPWYMLMELDNEVLVDDSEVPDCEWDEDDIIHKYRMADRFEKEIKPRLKLLHSFHGSSGITVGKNE